MNVLGNPHVFVKCKALYKDHEQEFYDTLLKKISESMCVILNTKTTIKPYCKKGTTYTVVPGCGFSYNDPIIHI